MRADLCSSGRPRIPAKNLPASRYGIGAQEGAEWGSQHPRRPPRATVPEQPRVPHTTTTKTSGTLYPPFPRAVSPGRGKPTVPQYEGKIRVPLQASSLHRLRPGKRKEDTTPEVRSSATLTPRRRALKGGARSAHQAPAVQQRTSSPPPLRSACREDGSRSCLLASKEHRCPYQVVRPGGHGCPTFPEPYEKCTSHTDADTGPCDYGVRASISPPRSIQSPVPPTCSTNGVLAEWLLLRFGEPVAPRLRAVATRSAGRLQTTLLDSRHRSE